MKASNTQTKELVLAPECVSDWMREMWEAEAKYTATIGSRLKFGLPLSPTRPKRARANSRKRAKVKA